MWPALLLAAQLLELQGRIEPAPEQFSQPQLLPAEIHLAQGNRAAALREPEEFLARRPGSPEAARVRRQWEELKAASPAP